MRTNIDIDDELIAEAMTRGGLKTKRAAVEEALRAYIAMKRELDIRELWGIGWDGDLKEWRRDDDHDGPGDAAR
jgi:Arc/MetJ family transcription regulator